MDRIRLLYYLICIPVRLLLALLAYYYHNKFIQNILVIFTCLGGLGFLYLYITNSRSKGAFGQKVWWNHLRLIHGILFISYAIFSKQESLCSRYAFIFLLIDVLISIVVVLRRDLKS